MQISRLLSLCLLGTLVGCSNSPSTSSSGSEGPSLNAATSVESSSGSQINMMYSTPIVVGEPHAFYFQLRPQGAAAGVTTGTVHWGDNSDARIRDDHNNAVMHTWNAEGSYDIAV